MTTLNEYQEKADTFAKHDHNDYPFMAIGEEVGELQGKLAKYGRKQGVTIDDVTKHATKPFDSASCKLRDDIEKELGDVLWNVSRCASVLGFSLDNIAFTNIQKLTDRNTRGVIVGEGDNR